MGGEGGGKKRKESEGHRDKDRDRDRDGDRDRDSHICRTNLLHSSGDHAARLSIISSKHGEGLAAACLPICKHAHIVAIHRRLHKL